MKILVPSSGKDAASEIADYVAQTAQRMGGTLIALHILADDETESDGEKCCEILREAGKDHGVEVVQRIAKGNVVEAIINAAEEAKADLILMGASKGTVVRRWLSADVMKRCEVPVLVVPHCYGQ